MGYYYYYYFDIFVRDRRFGNLRTFQVLMIFVVRPTNGGSLAQGLFNVGSGTGLLPRYTWHSPKCFRPRWYSSKKRTPRVLGDKLAPQDRVGAWGTAPRGSRGAGLSARDMDGGFPLPMTGDLDRRDEPSDQASQTDPRKQRMTRITRPTREWFTICSGFDS